MRRRRDNDEDVRRAEASLAELEAGRLPIPARERLDELRRRGGRFFTSDLSTAEFQLVREGGFRPLTQVMGSCFYHVGWQYLPRAGWGGAGFGPGMLAFGRGQTFELETETEAWNEARRLALGRLSLEAEHAGADAVVGVRIERGAYDWAQGLIEFVAVGTAVRSERYDLGHDTGVVLSSLSGQEFAKLVRSGWWPAGIVAGTTVAYVVSGWRQQRAQFALGGSAWQNQELEDFTRGVYDARSQALLRATRSAHELGAHGLIGVRLDLSQREHEIDQGPGGRRTDLILTLHVLGTAIVEVAGGPEPPPVYIALPLGEEHR